MANELKASLNYEAENNRIREELAKEKMQNESLRDDLERIRLQNAFLQGVQRTVEVIFGRDMADHMRC